MSQSDAAMRPGVGSVNVPPPTESAAGVTNLPAESPSSLATNLRLSLRKIISFPAMMAMVLVGGVLIGAPLRLPDPDTWWHVAVGQNILDTHTFPTSDPYSFTAPGTHWIAYEWLGEVAIG